MGSMPKENSPLFFCFYGGVCENLGETKNRGFWKKTLLTFLLGPLPSDSSVNYTVPP